MKKNNLPYRQNSGFRVPEDFFAQFEEEMLDMVKKSDPENNSELEKIKATGFATPPDFFKDFEKEFTEKHLKKSGRVIPLFNRKAFYYAAGIAAIFIAVFGSILLQPAQETTWDNVELSVLEDYIDEGYDEGFIELSTVELSSFIFEDGYVVDDSDFSQLNSDAALEYLDDNLEDPAYIFE